MASHEPLHGGCLCGRNQYHIHIPNNVAEHAEIYFDSGRDNRRIHGTPLTAWLRVPLSWYQSHTQSFFPDETHGTIRRIFSPHHAPHTQRVFCGFCGSPLTYWSEEPREDAEYMSVTIGSLDADDQRMLEDLDLLPGSESSSEEQEDDEENDEEEDEEEKGVIDASAPRATSTVVVPPSRGEGNISRAYRQGTVGGIPWFEEMIEGSRLGRVMKGRRGMGVSDDNSTTIEWEVSEWTNDDTGLAQAGSTRSSGKRKRGHTNVEEIEQPSKRTESP
ncbi:hypothetical protein P170DRAFT_436562 [Aspergillus steynii IBT 23096]|uniref:CENP-V/GFA domain-containing protein n=1 Tax=Aspergillus steynii IBT 23096 TaxID=1392250 RepID=A0A2I2G7N2_9EURO|nr:uncharacterized protein P170DRAFT_436562 [Aspergillus steynii IBT 23096]PLB48890.1 hypothetical protein P170DRAFT_436562 [Aspergillus steynii IBT 23096]